mgnify:FL=1
MIHSSMKKLQIIILLFVVFSFANAQEGVEKYFPKVPNPPRLVIDDEKLNLLTTAQEEALEKKLVAYDDSTSNQILIVTTADIGDYDISDFAVALGRKWGVGGKEFNNGLIIVVLVPNNGGKRQVWIATGYGLEGAIPDITAKQIIDNDIIPNFKANDIYRGLDEGTSDLIRAAAGEYKPPVGYSQRRKGGKKGGNLIVAAVIFVIIMIIISNINRRGGGGMMSRRGYRRWNNSPPIWWFPSGGGGGGGSGFGGFGGGSFGGGGAGGSW